MLVKHTYLALFLIYLVASSFYVFEPGLPQPADVLMAFLVVVLATGFIVKPAIHKDLVLFGLLFVGYVTLVNLFWYSQYQMKSFWLSPLYYAYDFGAMMVVLSLIRAFRERFVTVCQVALATAIVLEIVALFLSPGDTYRSIGTFNNPNQLGYWALLIGACTLVLQRDQKLSLLNLAVLCGAGYLTMASLSKAAMLSFALLLSLALVCQRLTLPTRAALVGVVLGGTAIALVQTSMVDQLMTQGVTGKVAHRFESLGKHGDDSMGGRGYDRIWRYPEHLVFGAGEGAGWRFAGPINPRQSAKEMHSTLGTVLFSYGIVGFSLFLALLAVVFRRAPLAHMLYSLPIWAYGMTHQGLRESMLWVFLGMVFGLAHYARSASPLAVSGGYPVVERGPGLLTGSQPSRLRANGLNTAEAQAIER